MKQKLILASGSKNRQQALTIARIPFVAVTADIDEKAIVHKDVRRRVVMIAEAKVDKVAEANQGLILGADGINLCNGKPLEKPESLDEACEMLKLQSGKKCSFVTGYVVKNTISGKVYKGVTESWYRFRELNDREIEDYVNNEPVMTWAAAFSPLNSSAIRFVEWMEGSPSQFAFSMPLDSLMPIFEAEGIV